MDALRKMAAAALLLAASAARGHEPGDEELLRARACPAFAVMVAQQLDGRRVRGDEETTQALVAGLRAEGAFDARSPCVLYVKVNGLGDPVGAASWEVQAARPVGSGVLVLASRSGMTAGPGERRRDEVQRQAEHFLAGVALPLARAARAAAAVPADAGAATGR